MQVLRQTRIHYEARYKKKTLFLQNGKKSNTFLPPTREQKVDEICREKAVAGLKENCLLKSPIAYALTHKVTGPSYFLDGLNFLISKVDKNGTSPWKISRPVN